MENLLNLEVLIATAREKYGLVLTSEQAQNAIQRGAPISNDGDFNALELAAWLIAEIRGGRL